jgi:hypothetical protein
MASQVETWAFAKEPWYRSYVRQARLLPLLQCLIFQTLRPNYSDQMAQFVFDVARHSDGMSDLLAQ